MRSTKLFWAQSALVGSGAIVGVYARELVYQIQFPLNFHGGTSLVLINTAGAMALGWLIAAGRSFRNWENYWRPLLTTGVLGGFTTTSGFAMVALALSEYQSWIHAALFVFGSVALAAAGFKVSYEIGVRR